MIKMLGVAGAALAATPLLGKASALQQVPGTQKAQPAAKQTTPAALQSYDKPLVLIVKGDQILGYRGLNEQRVQDSSLAGMLNGRFSSIGGSS